MAVTVPFEHIFEAVPPPLEEAIVRSYESEVNVKFPPVLEERRTTTLVAFTVSESATEPEAMVSVVAGEERETFVAFA
jgi:hypothetical protein